ncbi:hypothetical protein ACHAQJ_008352 [Trichoderma viride]
MPQINITVRAYAVTLIGKGYSRPEVERETGVKPSQITRLVRKALDRGWKKGEIALDFHVADSSRSGRPRREVKDGEKPAKRIRRRQRPDLKEAEKKDSATEEIHTENTPNE